MKRVHLAIGSLALVALLGIAMVGRSAVDAQSNATPDASGTPAAGGSTSTDDKESMKDTYLATLAEKLGITTEELQTAIDATNTELGVDGMMPGGMGGRTGMHRSGDNGFPGRGGPSHGIVRTFDFAAAATFLGITEDQLKTELRGSTFLDVATAHGKTTDEVRAFLIAQATVAIDERLQEAESDAPASSDATEVPAAPAITPTATA